MVKVAGPMMSLEASGSIGGVMVFSKWKGRPYVRSLVRPSNPKSGGQVGVRSMFKFLSQNWAGITTGVQSTWETRADQKVISPFNAYMGKNQGRWRDFQAPHQDDSGAEGDTHAVTGTITVVPGVRSITITVPITTAEDGWGVAVFRNAGSGFSSSFDNLIGVGLINATDDVVVVDTPLDPGTYYYNFRPFTLDGQLDDELGEETADIV